MFGEKIDYFLLRPLVHGHNRATEEQLNEQAENTSFTLLQARAYLKRTINNFGGKLVVDPDLSYLDIGCGMGRLSVGLALAGAKDVTAVDIVPRHIEEAKALAERLECADQPQFLCSDIHNWATNLSYDIIIVLGVMEHVNEPDKFLRRLPRLMKPNGIALIGHEPFQAPNGDHLKGFFRVQIPWRGLIFSEKALMRLRREFFRPTDPAARLCDIVGGLNQMSYSKFIRYSLQAGLKFNDIIINPQYKRIKPLYLISKVLTRIPVVRDYFATTVYAILKRAEN